MTTPDPPDTDYDFLAPRFKTGWPSHVDCGPGWIDLIRDLNTRLNELDPAYTVVQVKEKFGGLRFYLGDVNPDVEAEVATAVTAAEASSYTICDECGEPGRLQRSRYIIMTRCANCARPDSEFLD